MTRGKPGSKSSDDCYRTGNGPGSRARTPRSQAGPGFALPLARHARPTIWTGATTLRLNSRHNCAREDLRNLISLFPPSQCLMEDRDDIARQKTNTTSTHQGLPKKTRHALHLGPVTLPAQ